MSNNVIGMRKEQMDTPALCLDIELAQGNLKRMADYLAPLSCKLRPHFKTHKTPLLSKMQLDAGAVGITCAKLGEAEALARGGVRDMLIANQIVGAAKIARLVNLAAYTEVMVAVDNLENVKALAEAAAAKAVRLRTIIEVDVGMGRCGTPPGELTVALAREIAARPALRFEGIMGYEGHAVMIPNLADRRAAVEKAMSALVSTAEQIRQAGIPVGIVSAGGTGTYAITSKIAGVTDIQCGSYLTMDAQYRDTVGMTEFACALTVLATVIHTHGNVAIIDAGLKCITKDFGMPALAEPDGWKIASLSEEHGKLERVDGSALRVGDKVAVIPNHGCTTINLHDEYHVMRRGVLEAIWPIAGRGKSA
jgi:D-serine deaminase-like pyridoxal phosphate-dependent protein